jgi:streptogramin lyase
MRRPLIAVVIALSSVVANQTSAQSINEFPIPTAGGGPYGITTGPDGAVWLIRDPHSQ